MTEIQTIMFRRGVVRHLGFKVDTHIHHDHYQTLCGLDTQGRLAISLGGERKTLGYDLCKTCARVRRLADFDIVTPERDDAAIGRAAAMDAPVVEVEARVFRVQGTTDTYTVTIPDHPNLANLCNCMAGKVHPEKQCKHQATVQFLIDTGVGRFTTIKQPTTMSEATA